MKIGYIRVSTIEQNMARQEVNTNEMGLDELFMDRMSDKLTNSPERQRVIAYVRKANTAIMESISRFARNIRVL